MQTFKDPEQSDPPVAFISYSWASEGHIAWVTNLARRLRANGVDVHLDRWDVRLGHDLNLFMERYRDLSARVLVVLSDDYGPKADSRGLRTSGVGTETTIVSPTVYRDLGGNRVIPVIPDSGTVAGDPIPPAYLDGRSWIDFRGDHEYAYERLLRELHGVPIEAAPSLGPNPFTGTTEAQARAAIRNDPARWSDARMSGLIEVNMNENSGHFVLGSDETRFGLALDYPVGGGPWPGREKRVRHLSDQIGYIGLIAGATEQLEAFGDLATLPMSNRVETTAPGDVLVMVNRDGYWALLMLDDVVFRTGSNGYEAVAQLRYVIATDRTAELTLSNLPPRADADA
ncbi:toll/interleukin-1 receptor domain-containing protein [Frigoribacterium sp. VKM Ac-1396]|uniref:toll/interleukin-1 receptor domain-containing protein n=1 Tax=Frigoribacterium sp. VKM Ac-1396 TaxID=2783821 RepID=UPI001889F154|nr:toll/interleukin-1 receptor domain-containing protein [Frigoribacterium sp. VKM Ac-1396]